MSAVMLLESKSEPRSERVARVNEDVYQVQLQVAKLTSDVEHIKIDVADIKIDLRKMGERLDGKIDGVASRLDAKIDAVDARLHQFEKNVTEKFGSMKVWMLGLYIGQAASLLAILAKGFKWI